MSGRGLSLSPPAFSIYHPRFAERVSGHGARMIGAAFGLVILGIILLFLFPWAGVVVGAAGVILAVLFLVGFGRRAQTGRP